ncbi:hypothetical protein HYC85_012475 [Camellia sinensis]|uniref:Uncharacterized protein n=1 Tax=Camellia sinensis TaxID=4442 RepID=A0A7J7HC20_CAMSI|nr:hypothetical protein HYC85_012475 [Camellia sinensis]
MSEMIASSLCRRTRFPAWGWRRVMDWVKVFDRKLRRKGIEVFGGGDGEVEKEDEKVDGGGDGEI